MGEVDGRVGTAHRDLGAEYFFSTEYRCQCKCTQRGTGNSLEKQGDRTIRSLGLDTRLAAVAGNEVVIVEEISETERGKPDSQREDNQQYPGVSGS